jgi:hypothetical protein
MSDRRTTKRAKMGRPPLPNGAARTFIAQLPLNTSELEAIDKASKTAGTDRAKWMRKTLLEAAEAA